MKIPHLNPTSSVKSMLASGKMTSHEIGDETYYGLADAIVVFSTGQGMPIRHWIQFVCTPEPGRPIPDQIRESYISAKKDWFVNEDRDKIPDFAPGVDASTVRELLCAIAQTSSHDFWEGAVLLLTSECGNKSAFAGYADEDALDEGVPTDERDRRLFAAALAWCRPSGTMTIMTETIANVRSSYVTVGRDFVIPLPDRGCSATMRTIKNRNAKAFLSKWLAEAGYSPGFAEL